MYNLSTRNYEITHSRIHLNDTITISYHLICVIVNWFTR